MAWYLPRLRLTVRENPELRAARRATLMWSPDRGSSPPASRSQEFNNGTSAMKQFVLLERILCCIGLTLIVVALPGATLEASAPLNPCNSQRVIEWPNGSNQYRYTGCEGGWALCPHPTSCGERGSGGWTWCNCTDETPPCCYLRISDDGYTVDPEGNCGTTGCWSGTVCASTTVGDWIDAVCNP